MKNGAKDSNTCVDEIADNIYRISTPVRFPDGQGFTFNQFLIVDDRPLLFHSGPRKLFPGIRQAVATLMPVADLRYVAFSHVEADECGALNEWLAVAPQSVPLCSRIAAMTSITDMADRAPQTVADGDVVKLGGHTLRWFDTPHLPHGWECGYFMDDTTRTLLCGDLFTQYGDHHDAVTESDILGPSEQARQGTDYFANNDKTRPLLERLAAANPTTLACMHGSSWVGDGRSLLLELANVLDDERTRLP